MSAYKSLYFLLLVSVLSACSGSPLEDRFAADPALENQATPQVSPSPTATNDSQLPTEIPLYPGAKLLAKENAANNQGVITRWQSSDPTNLIESYYQKQLVDNNWEIVQPFTETDNTLIARRQQLELKIGIIPASANTEFTLEYQQGTTATPSPIVNNLNNPLTFTDLEQIAQPLRDYVADLAQLGVLKITGESDRFNPNQPITRREYARWLFNANNAIYANSPGKQIRAKDSTVSPIFSDLPPTDPDFGIIQGLAEAGLIPSPLTGDTNNLVFRADIPLTREDLINWKIPLDTRKSLPQASIDNLKETWGFQDVAKIDPKTLRSLYADYQNGEQANVRRVFGYTTLFQPKKVVTRAEAAAALWYFGYQGDGLSAKDALQTKNTPTPNN